MKVNTILSLDQASRVSGWSIFNNGDLIDFGHWTNDQEEMAARINSLCQQIQSKIDQYKPDIVVFEDIQQQRNDVATFKKLAQVQGAILYLCKLNNMPYRIYPPSTWRAKCKFLKHNDLSRLHQKRIAQQWVYDTFGMRCTQDEADAICIGYVENKEQNGRLDWT